MCDEYRTKKNDWLSQIFIEDYKYRSNDLYCDPVYLLFTIPIWRNPSSLGLDFSEKA